MNLSLLQKLQSLVGPLDLDLWPARSEELRQIKATGRAVEFTDTFEFIGSIDGVKRVVMSFEAWEELIYDPIVMEMVEDVDERDRPFDWAQIGQTRILVDFLPEMHRVTDPNFYYIETDSCG